MHLHLNQMRHHQQLKPRLAANAATSYDSFDDRYLEHIIAPSTDNDGNALVTGALYFDTTEGSMQVYESAWIATSAAQNVTILEYVYSITGNTTNITGSDDNSATLAFASQESVNVYLNGVQLIEGYRLHVISINK